MKAWGFFIFATLVGVNATARAESLAIVDVRRHITLHDDDIVYKDFYINGGESDGLKKNLVVTAVRKIQVRDASGSQSYGEIQIPVGQLRVIATYGKISVAREYKLLSRDELPMLEQIGLMNGDLIDLKGAFVDSHKPVYKKRSTAAVSPAPSASAPAPVRPAPVAPTAPKLEKSADAGAAKVQ